MRLFTGSRRLLLMSSLAFIGLLVFVRWYRTGDFQFAFLAWNIFLAGLPLLFSRLLHSGHEGPAWKRWAFFVLWLLFFPNAPYLVTDLIHFSPDGAMPGWYDALLLFSAAWLGMWLGLLSLPPVEAFLEAQWGPTLRKLAMPALFFLTAYGVYLGRVLRWNSWDMFTRPGAILYDTATRIRHPFHHVETWGLTLIMGMLLSLIYYGTKAGKISEFAN